MTMLELLELQYRAAAIRSQLAQEPLTKIELDSETEDNAPKPALSTDIRTPATADTAPVNPTAATTNGGPAVVASKPTSMEPSKSVSPSKPKPVRLKRNFRQRQDENYEPSNSGDESSVAPAIVESNQATQDAGATTTAASNSVPSATVSPSTVAEPSLAVSTNTAGETVPSTADESHTEPANANTVEPLDQQRAIRSPTPDVIPIVASPPTFCISSESEGEQEKRKQRTDNYINMPISVSINRPETEDEKFLRHVKESVGTTATKVTIVSSVTSQKVGSAGSVVAKGKDIFVTTPAVSTVEPAPVVPSPSQAADPVVVSDPEEGELTDDDGEIEESTSIIVDEPTTASSTDGEKAELENTVLSEQHETIEPAIEANAADLSDTFPDSSSRGSYEHETGCNQIVKTEPLTLTYTTTDVIALDDDDEDIIDLGKENLDDFEVDAPVASVTSAEASALDEGDSTSKDDDQSKVRFAFKCQ